MIELLGLAALCLSLAWLLCGLSRKLPAPKLTNRKFTLLDDTDAAIDEAMKAEEELSHQQKIDKKETIFLSQEKP